MTAIIKLQISTLSREEAWRMEAALELYQASFDQIEPGGFCRAFKPEGEGETDRS